MLIDYANIEKYEEIYEISDFFKNNLSESYSLLMYAVFAKKYSKLCWLARHETLLIGAILAKTEEDNLGYIGMLAIDKSFRNLGIGSQLLSLLMQSFRQIDVYFIYLETEDDNEASIRLYEKYKFCKIDYFNDYYLDNKNAYRMCRNLRD